MRVAAAHCGTVIYHMHTADVNTNTVVRQERGARARKKMQSLSLSFSISFSGICFLFVCVGVCVRGRHRSLPNASVISTTTTTYACAGGDTGTNNLRDLFDLDFAQIVRHNARMRVHAGYMRAFCVWKTLGKRARALFALRAEMRNFRDR